MRRISLNYSNCNNVTRQSLLIKSSTLHPAYIIEVYIKLVAESWNKVEVKVLKKIRIYRGGNYPENASLKISESLLFLHSRIEIYYFFMLRSAIDQKKQAEN